MNQQVRLAADRRARFSTAEFSRILAAGQMLDIRLELVDGELNRMTPPMGTHFSRQTALIARLWQIVGDRAAVEAGIDLGEDTVIVCDVVVLCERMNDHRFLGPHEVELAIEISETSVDRDLSLKRARYAAAAIPFYWVIDGKRAVIHCFGEPVDGEYASVATVRFGEKLVLPGTDTTITID